jgi:tetratricopeptide (TPR) repeat protein
MLTDVAIEVPGAAWSAPRRIASARPGSRVMVYARMPAKGQSLTAIVNGHRRTVGITSGAPALVQRAIAAAEIGELEARLAGVVQGAGAGAGARETAQGLKAEIAKRSVAARVVSSQTALLVLESEGDYARFGIDRNALVDILEIAADGSLALRHRTMIAAPTPPPVNVIARDAKDEPKKKVPEAKPDATRDVDLGAGRADGPADEGGAEAGDMEEAPKTLAEAPREPGVARPEAPAPEPTIAPAPAPPPPPARMVVRAEEADDDAPARNRRAFVGGRPRSEESNPLEQREAWPPKDAPPALKGELAEIMRAPRSDAALAKARAWHLKEPGNVLALLGLGEVLEARAELDSAARMYGSIIDLFPGRADLRRFAGERLERIGDRARALAIDTYRRAVEDRPDHATGHRLLAYALLRAGRPADAFAAILAGVEQEYPSGRFRGADRVLAEDAGLIGAAYAAAAPNKRAEIEAALGRRQLAIATAPSTRFVLYWETDANDVDFHIQDARGGHAWYSSKQLPSGGELFEDVTTGYGPECFAIPGVAMAGPYRLSINYYSQGPMGYGMGLLQIVRHDGGGKLAFEDRPYVIMNDHAYVDLGAYR